VSIRDDGAPVAGFSRDASQSIIRAVDHVHVAVSGMIGRLRPVGLDELGLVAAIEHCVDEWRQRLPGTRFTLSTGGTFDDLSESLTLTVYRLIQEGLTNISKHAHATEARVALERMSETQGSANELRLSVADDGRGMDLSSRRSRFGLSGMRERVEMSGGTFELASAPGRGLRFSVRLPAGGDA
jgi:signal transduction histidine kinase